MKQPAAIDVEIANLASALAHPARVQIVRALLRHGASTVGDLVAELPLAQSTVSEHLRVLREAGVVVVRRDGPRRYHDVEVLMLRRLSSLVASVAVTAPRRP